MAPVLPVLFGQLRRRLSARGHSGWKTPRIQAGGSPEVSCPPSHPQDSQVEYGEVGPLAQVIWSLNTGSLANLPPPVHTTWPRLQKGAPCTVHQEAAGKTTARKNCPTEDVHQEVVEMFKVRGRLPITDVHLKEAELTTARKSRPTEDVHQEAAEVFEARGEAPDRGRPPGGG